MRIALIILATFATGCVSTQHVDVYRAHEVDDYNTAYRQTEAVVRIDENNRPRTMRADSTKLGKEFLSVYMRGIQIDLPFDRIEYVEVPSGQQKVVAVMATGAVAGAAAGATAGYSMGDPPSCDFICFYKRDMALVGGILGSAAGALLGGIVGAAGNERKVIRFRAPRK